MKILVSCEDFYPIGGGAETFLEEALEGLGKKHEVQIHYIGKPNPKAKNYQCFPKSPLFALKFPLLNRTLIRHYFANIRWKRYFSKIVAREKPDLILTQLMYTPSTVDVAKKYNIPVVVYLHNYEHFCPYLFKTYDPLTTPKAERKKHWPLSVKLQQPFVNLLLRWHERALKKADLIIANSASMGKILKHFYALPSRVLFPVMDVERYSIKRRGEYITFINPIKAKGVEVFLKIAKEMPEQKFLVVGGIFPEYLERVKQLPNIKYLPWTNEMKEVYKQTRVLLVPSLWPEPFGRIPLEAGISGIPSIVSRRGGLPEAAGKGGIIIEGVNNINAWKAAIHSLDNKKTYQVFSFAAKRHADEYTKEKQLKRFEALLKSVVKK